MIWGSGDFKFGKAPSSTNATQAVMDLHSSNGKLVGAVESLAREISKQDATICELNKKVDSLSHS